MTISLTKIEAAFPIGRLLSVGGSALVIRTCPYMAWTLLFGGGGCLKERARRLVISWQWYFGGGGLALRVLNRTQILFHSQMQTRLLCTQKDRKNARTIAVTFLYTFFPRMRCTYKLICTHTHACNLPGIRPPFRSRPCCEVGVLKITSE